MHFATMRFTALPNALGLPTENLVAEETRHFVSLTFRTKRTVLIGKSRDFADTVAYSLKEEGTKEAPKERKKDGRTPATTRAGRASWPSP